MGSGFYRFRTLTVREWQWKKLYNDTNRKRILKKSSCKNEKELDHFI